MKVTAIVENPDGSVVGLMTDGGEVEIPSTKDIHRSDLEEGAKLLFAQLGVTADLEKMTFAGIEENPPPPPPENAP